MTNDVDYNKLFEEHLIGSAVDNFAARVYLLSKATLAFEKWYFEVFQVQHPELPYFEVNRVKNDRGDEAVEVIADNPSFGIDALEAMFQAYYNKQLKAEAETASTQLSLPVETAGENVVSLSGRNKGSKKK